MSSRHAVVEDASEIRDCAQRAYARYIPLTGQKPAATVADFVKQIAAGSVCFWLISARQQTVRIPGQSGI